MNEYLEHGASLGWLIDPLKRLVYVYRDVEILHEPQFVSGALLLEGFNLKMEQIW